MLTSIFVLSGPCEWKWGKLKTVEIYTNINNIKLTHSSISYHFFVETLMIITHLSFITLLKHYL